MGTEIGRGVKEKLCFLAFDYDTVLNSIAESSNKRSTCSQTDTTSLSAPNVFLIFQPSVIGKDASGIHVSSFRSPSLMYFLVLLCLQFFFLPEDVERLWLHPRWFPMWLLHSYGAA